MSCKWRHASVASPAEAYTASNRQLTCLETTASFVTTDESFVILALDTADPNRNRVGNAGVAFKVISLAPTPEAFTISIGAS